MEVQIDYPADGIRTASHGAPDLPTWHIAALPRATSVSRLLGELIGRWVGPAAIALVLFEAIVRLFIYSPRPQVYDPLLGQVPAPGSTWVNGREGFGRTHWSRQSIRGRDLPTGSERSVRRIVVMGDSFTEAEGVNDNQTYCARLEAELSGRLHHAVWVGNCGRPGLDAPDYLHYLPAFEKRFHPELIVITYNLSDFHVSHHLITGFTAQYDPAAVFGRGLMLQPLSKSREDALLDRYAPRPVARLGHGLIDHSGLALYGAARLYALRWRAWPDDKFINHKEQIATVEQMERYFASLIALSKTPIACVFSAPWSPLRGPNNYWDQITEQRLTEATARLGILFVPTRAVFQRQFPRTEQPPTGFFNTAEGPGSGHLNPEGHRILAESMAPAIARLLASRSGLRSLRRAEWRAHAAGTGALAGLFSRAPQRRLQSAAATRSTSGSASS